MPCIYLKGGVRIQLYLEDKPPVRGESCPPSSPTKLSQQFDQQKAKKAGIIKPSGQDGKKPQNKKRPGAGRQLLIPFLRIVK